MSETVEKEPPLEDALENIMRKMIHETLIGQIESEDLWDQDEIASRLSCVVVKMAGLVVQQLLVGNEDQMRSFLCCEKSRETGEYSWWHPVIREALSENGAMARRKAIVEAHRDLLVNERILDLEDQVESLVAQVNKKAHENDELRVFRDLWNRK